MPFDRDHTTEFLARVNVLLAEAKATKATIAQTHRILARELDSWRNEMLKQICRNAVDGGQTFKRH